MFTVSTKKIPDAFLLGEEKETFRFMNIYLKCLSNVKIKQNDFLLYILYYF